MGNLFGPPFFPVDFQVASEGVEKQLQVLHPELEELSSADVEKITPRHHSEYVKGWRFECNIRGDNVKIALLLCKWFPLRPPSIFLTTYQLQPIWLPHVDAEGKLCILGPQDVVIPERDGAICKYLLEEAERLLMADFLGENDGHFFQEFESYWANFQIISGVHGTQRWSILDAEKKKSRVICLFSFIFYDKKRFLLAENKDQGEKWIISLIGNLKKTVCEPASFLWLDKGLPPYSFPQKNVRLIDLLEYTDDSAIKILFGCVPGREKKNKRKISKLRSKGLTVCFGFDTDTGPALAGLTALPPARSCGPALPPTEWQPANSDLVKATFFAYFNGVIPFSIKRLDHAFMYFRGGDGTGKELYDIKIALIGAGSLGGRVAEQLCMAGIGNIDIYDPDTLNTENVGRHILGVESVGLIKSAALAEMLLRRFPQLTIKSHPLGWEEDLQNLQGRSPILGADMIISTIGELQSNRFLNAALAAQKFKQPIPPIIFSWGEPFCCAGKAVYVDLYRGCLECGVDSHVSISTQATIFSEGILQRMQPACGDSFMPYGALEMSSVASMTTTLAIQAIMGKVEPGVQRIYVGSQDLLDIHQGKWADWIAPYINVNQESMILSFEWKANPSCPICQN